MSTPQFQIVRRDFDRVWLSADHKAFITYSEPVRGIREGFFQAYRAPVASEQPWNCGAKRVGSADGFATLEAAAAAVAGA